MKFRSLLPVAAVQLLIACSISPVPKEVPLAEQTPQEPLAPHEFVLAYPDDTVIGEPQLLLTRYEDTFADIARAYGLGYDELVAANPSVDPWLPGEGTPLLLPTQYVLPEGPRDGLVLNVAARRLFYYPPRSEGEPQRVLSYPIGIGRVGWETPLGATKIVSKVKDPSWHVPQSVRAEHAANGDPLPAVVPPGPDNPLGQYAMRLQLPSYLIHGTNKPYGVGMRISHGCVRMYPENIELLFPKVEVGTAVNIVNQPYLAGWRDGEIYVEAHPVLEDDAMTPAVRLEQALARVDSELGERAPADVQALTTAVIEASAGVPVQLLQEDAGQVSSRARLVHNTLAEDDIETADASSTSS